VKFILAFGDFDCWRPAAESSHGARAGAAAKRIGHHAVHFVVHSPHRCEWVRKEITSKKTGRV
jgi:hypothetical protein